MNPKSPKKDKREYESVTVVIGNPIPRGKTCITYKDGIKTVTHEDIDPNDPIFSDIAPGFIPFQKY